MDRSLVGRMFGLVGVRRAVLPKGDALTEMVLELILLQSPGPGSQRKGQNNRTRSCAEIASTEAGVIGKSAATPKASVLETGGTNQHPEESRRYPFPPVEGSSAFCCPRDQPQRVIEGRWRAGRVRRELSATLGA
jgi:hypothetical protein